MVKPPEQQRRCLIRGPALQVSIAEATNSPTISNAWAAKFMRHAGCRLRGFLSLKRDSTEEPDEVKLHVRICGEGAG